MRVSLIFETEAIIPEGAPKSWDLPYYNLVVSGKTALSPGAVLSELKQIESSLGRDLQAPRWSPRVIDLDILAWDEKVISQEGLTIPHPELLHRPFLLKLMATLKPDWRYPVAGSVCSHLSLDEIIHRQIPVDKGLIRSLVFFPLLVGIINVTPDSFSDGGFYLDPQKAIKRMEDLSVQGAAVIDLGAQSTRPGAKNISAEEEWKRLEPIFHFFDHSICFMAIETLY